MTLSKLKKVENALSKAIPEGKALSLGEDIFLCGMLAGEDKVYGFYKLDGELNVVTREAGDGFPVNQMDKEDIDYIVNYSAPNILEKIKGNKYEIVEIEDM